LNPASTCFVLSNPPGFLVIPAQSTQQLWQEQQTECLNDSLIIPFSQQEAFEINEVTPVSAGC